MVATTEEYDYNRKDDDPGAVVVKDVAKTVVIHMFFLQGQITSCVLLIIL